MFHRWPFGNLKDIEVIVALMALNRKSNFLESWFCKAGADLC